MRKRELSEDVYSLACERTAHIFDRFDHVAVMFSGGKDSTVCLELALAEATRRRRLPLDVIFFDEEAQAPETIEYMTRTQRRPGVALRWYCLPVKHRNACSRKQPFWHPWAPEHRDLWCRPLPPGAITELEGFNRRPIPELAPIIFPPHKFKGQVGEICGIRAAESLRRYRSVTSRVHENYIAPRPNASYVYFSKPIYDWTTDDVWTAPFKYGWDYNKAYDVLEKAGVPRHVQRVCPPYGEEPLQNLWTYAECWPDLWEKMIRRVPGAATAARYSRSPVYGFNSRDSKNEHEAWQTIISDAIKCWPPEIQKDISYRIKCFIDLHNKDTNGAPIPDTEDHPISGISWAMLRMIAIRGDLKNRKNRRIQSVARPEDGKKNAQPGDGKKNA